MKLSSFYEAGREAYIYFALSALHATRGSLATGYLTPESVSATTPDSFEGNAQRPASVLVSQPVDWLFFPSCGYFPYWSPISLAYSNIISSDSWLYYESAIKLTLTLYVDAVPGADAGILKYRMGRSLSSGKDEVAVQFHPELYPGTSEEIPIKSLTEREYGTDELFLSGFDGYGAAVNILIGRGPHRKRGKKPRGVRKRARLPMEGR